MLSSHGFQEINTQYETPYKDMSLSLPKPSTARTFHTNRSRHLNLWVHHTRFLRKQTSSPPSSKANNMAQSAQFRFPFIDLLGDGYSTFSYIPALYISNDPIAIAGSRAYYEETLVATFNPPLDPYAAVPGSKNKELFFDVFLNNTSVLNATFRPQHGIHGKVGDYPLDL